MNLFKRYINYLRDNPEGYWFKRKLYGWGWVPAKWQGWLIIVIFLILVLLNGLSLTPNQKPTNSESFWFFARFILFVAVLIWICYNKGEKPRWQWGMLDRDSDKLENK